MTGHSAGLHLRFPQYLQWRCQDKRLQAQQRLVCMLLSSLHAANVFARYPHPFCCSGALSKHQTELVNLTAKEAVDRLCSGQITSTEYTSSLLAQIELHACLNNFAALEPEKVWPFVISREPAKSQALA